MRFENKVVLVTGAAGGIGTEITLRFLTEGAKVVATDISGETLENLKKKIGVTHSLFTVVADITNEKSCQELAQQVAEKWGQTDIVINNAGWYPVVSFEEVTYSLWRQVMAVNLDGAFLITHSFLSLLKQSGNGRIVNISSGTFFSPPPGQVHYVAAKAGVIGLTRALAMELGQYNITVNAITPGLVTTAALEKALPSEFIQLIANNGAMKREQLPQDLVGAISFLASDDASFITGQTLNVDGGRNFN